MVVGDFDSCNAFLVGDCDLNVDVVVPLDAEYEDCTYDDSHAGADEGTCIV